MWPSHAPCSKFFSRSTSPFSLGACLPNLKFVSLVILEIFAFNAHEFTGSHDPGHTPFSTHTHTHTLLLTGLLEITFSENVSKMSSIFQWMCKFPENIRNIYNPWVNQGMCIFPKNFGKYTHSHIWHIHCNIYNATLCSGLLRPATACRSLAKNDWVYLAISLTDTQLNKPVGDWFAHC